MGKTSTWCHVENVAVETFLRLYCGNVSDSWPQMFRRVISPSVLITDFSIWWRDGGRNNFLIDLKEIGQSSNCFFFFCFVLFLVFLTAATRCMFSSKRGPSLIHHSSLLCVWKLPAHWKQHFLFVTHAYFMSSRDHNCFFGRDVSH